MAQGINKPDCRTEFLLVFSLPSEDICREIGVTNVTRSRRRPSAPVDTFLLQFAVLSILNGLGKFPCLSSFCSMESFDSPCTF